MVVIGCKFVTDALVAGNLSSHAWLGHTSDILMANKQLFM